VASTCLRGVEELADVHSVYARDERGNLKRLALQEMKWDHQWLFGTFNSEFRIENGLLLDVYTDNSGRDDPVVIKYKWNAAEEVFAIVSIVAAKPYTTSYDCAKAEKVGDGTALAVCYVKSLAMLDVELAKQYKTYLAELSGESRKAAVEEQRAWLKLRNENCVIYMYWVECLTKAYNARIAELTQKLKSR